MDPANQPRKEVKMSIGGCRQFNTGRTCPRVKTQAGCPYVHNPALRSAAVAAVAATKKKEGEKRPALATITEEPSIPKKTKPMVLKITDNKPQKSTQKENTPIQELCRFFVQKGFCKREKCRYIHDQKARLEFLRIAKEKPDDEKVKQRKRRVPLQLNDSNLPITTLATTSASKSKNPQRNTDNVILPHTRKDPSTPKPTFAEAVRKTAESPSDNHPASRNNLLTPPLTPPKIVTPTLTIPEGQSTPKSTVTSVVPTVHTDIITGPTTNFRIQQSWDPLTLKRWASQNLSPAVLSKYLTRYGAMIEKGNIPLAALCYTEPRNVKKIKKNARKPLTEFHFFPHLPAELQDQIWKFHLRDEQEQCIITLKREKVGTEVTAVFKRRSPLPTAFVVNRHLREVAQKHYRLSFGTDDSAPHCYFSFRNDRLFLCNHGALDLLPSTSVLSQYERKRIRLLAVSLRDWIRGDKIDFGKAISRFIHLQSLHIIVGDSKEDVEFTKESARMLEKIRKQVGVAWKIFNEPYGRRKPNIHILVIPALQAKELGIDGLRW